jgi:adenine-specific DNA glycosylase
LLASSVWILAFIVFWLFDVWTKSSYPVIHKHLKLISSKLTWVNRFKAGLKVYLKNRWRQRWCCGGSDFPFVEDEEERRKKKEERRRKKKEERRKKI